MKKIHLMILTTVALCLSIIVGGGLLNSHYFNLPVNADISEYQINMDENTNLFINDNYGEASIRYSTICFSNCEQYNQKLAKVLDRGIIANKTAINSITKVRVDFDSLSKAYLYYGNYFLSFENVIELSANNTIDLSLCGCSFFTIQSEGESVVSSLSISYTCSTIYEKYNLPTVNIVTELDEFENHKPINSRENYTNCNVSISDSNDSKNNLKPSSAEVKIRGNSTATLPKKAYRIKFDKKQSVFGLEKNKNWVLLADYMDASKMHNYSALSFAELVKQSNTFAVHPTHVNVRLNGEDIGLYLMCEHIDAKAGRLNLEQENIWEKSFGEINFYIERDLSTKNDSLEIEGETYFKINVENYSPSQYVFALKYPEKEDFVEELEGGETNNHEDEFHAFFNQLENYIQQVCDAFRDYSLDHNQRTLVENYVDLDSLAEYAVVDQTFRESDHSQKSFKMYRIAGELLKFGPNWDYDSCCFGLPYLGTYVSNPFSVGRLNDPLYFGEGWGRILYNDTSYGRQLLKEVWLNITDEMISNYQNNLMQEYERISSYLLSDCSLWVNNQLYVVFDNLRYSKVFVTTAISYLRNYYCKR